jgi:hypothetical protein
VKGKVGWNGKEIDINGNRREGPREGGSGGDEMLIWSMKTETFVEEREREGEGEGKCT